MLPSPVFFSIATGMFCSDEKAGLPPATHECGGSAGREVSWRAENRMDIKDGVGLVTGGARRVGRSIALELARSGANVVILYNASADAAAETAAEASALGVEAMPVQCDVADLAAVQRMAREVRARFGRLDVLVNSADWFAQHPFPTNNYDTWRRILDITVHGSFFVSNELAPLLLEQPEAAIVNIVDLSVWQAWPGFTAHAVAKSGLLALTRQLALELAPTVRVNAVAPGSVMPRPTYGAERMQRSADRTLMKRWGAPDDVAQAVRFLVESSFMTGEVVRVDGGELIGLRSISG